MKGDVTLKNIRIENIRSLKDTGEVTLAPITLLVGENSSGKSTFLRTFPLIKQSIQKKTNGPLLWAGDVDDYVDFGSFEETLTVGGAKNMVLTFSFPLVSNKTSLPYFWFSELNGEQTYSVNVKYRITIEQNKGKEYVSELDLDINDIQYKFLAREGEDTSILINNVPVEIPKEDEISKLDRATYIQVVGRFNNIFGFRIPDATSLLREEITVPEEYKAHASFYEEAIHDSAMYTIGAALIQSVPLDELFEYILNCYDDDSPHGKLICSAAKELIAKAQDQEKAKKNLFHSALLFYFYYSFSDIENYLGTYFRQVHYIAPLRATAERYYRLRNSAIDEVDYQGKNLAIFLNSLPTKRMELFQQWTMHHFGFKTLVKKSEGHLSIKVAFGDGARAMNLSDTGFGYSQILPIITQLWELSTRKKPKDEEDDENIPLVIAIEQPELHLHPAMQARLAKAFIACIKLAREHGYELQLLLETHSQPIVDYFGRAIARKDLENEDVVVILFERSLDAGQTMVRTSHYDENGYLLNWPVGFFAPGE